MTNHTNTVNYTTQTSATFVIVKIRITLCNHRFVHQHIVNAQEEVYTRCARWERFIKRKTSCGVSWVALEIRTKQHLESRYRMEKLGQVLFKATCTDTRDRTSQFMTWSTPGWMFYLKRLKRHDKWQQWLVEAKWYCHPGEWARDENIINASGSFGGARKGRRSDRRCAADLVEALGEARVGCCESNKKRI